MKLLLTTCAFVLSLTTYAQKGVIVRIVNQMSEEPLAKASAHLLTDTATATANALGYLKIDATPGDSLVLTAPGYLQKEEEKIYR